MKTKRKHEIFAGILLIAVLTLGFQNCGNAKFTAIGDEDLSSFGGPILCDPFSTPGGCGTNVTTKKGLLGNVYYYPNGLFVDEYINLGKQQKIRVLLTKLDIPERAWDKGFVLPDGNVLNNDDNQPLIEWFAIDFKGFIETPAGLPKGDYQFAFASDDGTILDIDGQEILNHDGHHPTQWKCASTKVSLPEPGTKLPIRVRYFQGPRYHITLQMYWRPWSQRNKGCDGLAKSGFQIVPAEAFSH